jgi:hypothetical protein
VGAADLGLAIGFTDGSLAYARISAGHSGVVSLQCFPLGHGENAPLSLVLMAPDAARVWVAHLDRQDGDRRRRPA